MIKVSIIVPVYNGEKYLSRSIESLISQTLKEIEIILINDGSTDNSLEVCKEYSSKDKRIKVINKLNEGVAAARNLGIEEAKGEYIAFLDADDYVEGNMYEKMYSKITATKSDICICNYIIEDRGSLKKVNHNLQKDELTHKEIYNEIIPALIGPTNFMTDNGLTGYRGPVMYIYSKKILNVNNIRFKKGMPIGEDFLFNLEYLTKISTFAVEKGYYYHYCINAQSAMQRYRENWWDIHKVLIKRVAELLNREGLDKINQPRIDTMKINYLIGALVNECHPKNNKKYICKIKTMKKIIEDSETEIIYYNTVNWKITRKIWFSLIKKRRLMILYVYYSLKNSAFGIKE